MPFTVRPAAVFSCLTGQGLLASALSRDLNALLAGALAGRHEFVETTYVYLHADLKLKEQAMAGTAPSQLRPARYRPDDDVLAFLNSL